MKNGLLKIILVVSNILSIELFTFFSFFDLTVLTLKDVIGFLTGILVQQSIIFMWIFVEKKNMEEILSEK